MLLQNCVIKYEMSSKQNSLQKVLSDNKIVGYLPINSPIESLFDIWRFVRPPEHRFHDYMPHHHVLQLILSGSYALRINKREYKVKTGDLIYYFANEDVQWLGNEQEVVFYSISFRSTAFRPIPIEKGSFLQVQLSEMHLNSYMRLPIILEIALSLLW